MTLSNLELTRTDIEGFLLREAMLLDARDYASWLDLFDQDSYYWIPSDNNDGDPEDALNIAYALKPDLVDRVHRLTTGDALTQGPPPAVVRLLSSPVVTGPNDAGIITTSCAFVIYESRRGEVTSLAGRYEHQLAAGGDGSLQIRRKKVVLLDPSRGYGDLSYLP